MAFVFSDISKIYENIASVSLLWIVEMMIIW